MKIAMIGQKGIPATTGGVERHVEEISKRLVQMGHEVTVYCRSTYSTERLDRYEGISLRYVNTLDNKNLEAIIYTAKAVFKAMREGYDIYHFHALGPTSLSFLPKLLGKKVVATIHGLDWQRDKWGKAAKAYLKLGEAASAIFPDRIIAVSENLRRYYMVRHRKQPDQITFIPNGVNIKPPVDPSEIKRFNLEKGGYILFLARLVPEKGAHYLIEAYRRLRTDKKLVIAGGASHTENYVERLQASAKGVPGIIFTGKVQGRLLEELYSNTYLYVLPSEIEGMPITLLEAMSYARCCLTSDIPENRDVIKDRFGMTFRKADVANLRDRLQYLLERSDLAGALGNAAFEEIKEKYDWQKITEQTLQVYLDLAEQRR